MTTLMQFFATKLTDEELELSKTLGYGDKTKIFKKLLMLVLKRDEIKGDLSDLEDIIQDKFFRVKLIIPVSKFICSAFGRSSCTPMGLKIGDSLIRVAATRIFADPEQSIMELPVNSIDSYNSKIGIPPVGKFGMGFFSILYWISEPLKGKWLRYLTVNTIVEEDGKNISYSIRLQWSSNGLAVDKEKLETEKPTGTSIVIDASKHPFSKETLERMKKYMDRLFAIDGARILVDGKCVNRECQSKNSITVNLSVDKITVVDKACGIPFSVIENSLLVPSSSSKIRDLSKPIFKNPEILDLSSRLDKTQNRLSIVVNGVCIVETTCDSTNFSERLDNYVIFLPFNTKLPVSRDDVIFEENSDAIEHFKEAVYILVDMILSYDKDIYKLFHLITKYIVLNKSTCLSIAFDEIRNTVLNSEYIFVEGSSFWCQVVEHTKSKVKDLIVFTDSIDTFKTEKKLLAAIPSTKKNIFKCRNVIPTSFPIKNNVESGGLNTILFIEAKQMKDPDFLSKLVFSYTDTLLIPHEDTFSLDTRFDFVDPRITDAVLDAISVCKMTISRKFCTCNSALNKMSEIPEQVAKFAFEIKTNTTDSIIQLLYTLNSKIAKIKILPSYGIADPKVYDNIRIPVSEFIEPVKNTELDGFRSKLFEFYFECIPDIIDSFMILPSLSDFNILTNKSDGSNISILKDPNFGKVIKGEKITLDEIRRMLDFNISNKANNNISGCSSVGIFKELNFEEVGKGEIFVLNAIHRMLVQNISKKSVIDQDKFWNSLEKAGHFALSELRRYTHNSKIENFLQGIYSRICDFGELKTNTIIPVNNAILKFVENSLKLDKMPKFSTFFEGRYKFSCKSLLSFIFQNNELPENYLNVLTEHYSNFGETPTKLQILEIAVNEGTTKRFIPSIITEMVQNSVDAIRSSNGNRRIDINTGSNFFTISDYIGIENFINILIPFLSSKDPNDPNVTGEMGTGFFNVYRQPYVKQVIITTSINGRSTTILAKPVVENGNVTDIIYQICTTESDKAGTSISVVFNNDIALMSSLIVESLMFVMNYLCFITSADIYIEGLPISTSYKIIHESDIGTVLLTADPTLYSYVLTNDIPFCTLEEFIKNEFVDQSIKDIANGWLMYGVVINIKKSIYTPTQSRNKIQLKPDMIPKMKTFLTNFADLSLYNKYVDSVVRNPDRLLTHTLSYAKIQSLGSINNRCGILAEKGLPVKTFVDRINELIFGVQSGSIKSLSDIPKNTLEEKVVFEWFRRKDFTNNNSLPSKVRDPSIRKKCEELTRFLRIYWEHLKKLKTENKISGFSLKEPPNVFFDSADGKVLGYFDLKKNEIILNVEFFDKDLLESEIKKTTIDMIRRSPASFIMNPIFRKYFSTSLPACTFVHEITHAIIGTGHVNDSHSNTSIKIGNLGPGLSFDETASLLFTAALESGTINEFFA